MKKYELTNEKINANGVTLYRIRALKTFFSTRGLVVKQGELGGFIQSETNLSQDGFCWVGGNAKVYENAKVTGDSVVLDNAQVYGDAKMLDNACASGNAVICGSTKVWSNGCVCGNGKIWGNTSVGPNSSVC